MAGPARAEPGRRQLRAAYAGGGLTGAGGGGRRAMGGAAGPGRADAGGGTRRRGDGPGVCGAAGAGGAACGAGRAAAARGGPEQDARYATRAARADPVADLAAAHRAGGRFLCPGDGDWPGQLDDLGVQRPYGLWVRGGPSLRLWALRSWRWSAPGPARTTAGTWRCGSARASPVPGWVVVSGAAYGVDGPCTGPRWRPAGPRSAWWPAGST